MSLGALTDTAVKKREQSLEKKLRQMAPKAFVSQHSIITHIDNQAQPESSTCNRKWSVYSATIVFTD